MPRLSARPPGYTVPPLSRLGRRPRDTAIITDYRPPPYLIPICWLTGDVTLRLDQPINTATVTQSGVGDAYAESAASVAEYGVWATSATLYDPIPEDAGNLASWTVNYFASPRMRAPSLTLDLLAGGRTDAEIAMLLRIPRFSRIQLTGVPAEFPEGASTLIVRGVTHQRGIQVRRMTITTGPVVGAVLGTPGPWFRIDSSTIGGSDVVPF